MITYFIGTFAAKNKDYPMVCNPPAWQAAGEGVPGLSVQATLLVFPATAAGTGIVTSDTGFAAFYRHNGRKVLPPCQPEGMDIANTRNNILLPLFNFVSIQSLEDLPALLRGKRHDGGGQDLYHRR